MDLCRFKSHCIDTVIKIVENIDNKELVKYMCGHLMNMIDGFKINVSVDVNDCFSPHDLETHLQAVRLCKADYDDNPLTP